MVIALRSALADHTQSRAQKASMSQVAALCYRETDDEMEILLITSSHGRWILPKGWPMDDRSDAEAAKQEAWEEAGVKKGTLGAVPVGSYVNTKAFDNGDMALCDTTVFAIEVTKLVDKFPEAKSRKRKWVPLDDVADTVDDADLAVFLRRLTTIAS